MGAGLDPSKTLRKALKSLIFQFFGGLWPPGVAYSWGLLIGGCRDRKPQRVAYRWGVAYRGELLIDGGFTPPPVQSPGWRLKNVRGDCRSSPKFWSKPKMTWG